MDISGYIADAKLQTGISSDRELSLALGLDPGMVHTYKTEKANPSERVIMLLAEAAGRDPIMAVLQLKEATSKGPAREAYREIRRRLTAAAGVLILALGIAGTNPAQGNTGNAQSIYYGKLKRFLLGWSLSPRFSSIF